MAALRTLLADDADLLTGPRTVKPRAAPGAHPLHHGDITDTFVMERSDGTRFLVQAPSTTSQDASTWVPDAAISRLNALADAVLHPEILGADSLASSTWAVYQPEALAVVVRLMPAVKPVPFDGPFGPDIQKTGWPFGGAPDSFGASFRPNPLDDFLATTATATFRCAFLSSGDTLRAVAGLPLESGASLAADEVAAGDTWGSSGLRWGDDLDVSIRVVGLLPEDLSGSCADAFSY